MSNVGFATLTIIPSAKGFGKLLSGDVNPLMGSAGADSGKLFAGGLGGSLKGLVGPAMAAAGALGAGAFVKGAIAGAANLEQSIGAIDAIFKGSAGQMHSWADSAAVDVGLTKNEFNELGSLIGAQLKNGGTAMDELGPKTQSLIGLGADLSSMFGGTTREAVEAISSALKGEMDPIEKYGISLNEVALKAEALSLGLDVSGASLSNSTKQAAAMSLMMKQSADASGNFARESDTVAHKQQVLNAMWEDGKARLGDALLPAVGAFTGMLIGGLGPALDTTEKGLRFVTDADGTFAAAFNGQAPTAAMGAWTEPLTTFGANARKLLDTIGVDIDGSGGLFPALGKWYVFDYAAAIWSPILDVASALFRAGEPLRAVLSGALTDALRLVGGYLRVYWTTTFRALAAVLPPAAALVGQLAAALGGYLLTVLPTVAALVGTLVGVLSGGLVSALPSVVEYMNAFMGALAAIVPAVTGILAATIPLAAALAASLAPMLTQLIASVLPPVVAVLGLIVGAIAPLVSMLAELLIPTLAALMPLVVTVFQVIVDIVSAAMQIVNGIIQVATGLISGNWGQVWQGIGNIVGGVWDLIGSTITGALALLVGALSAGLGIVRATVSTVFGWIGNFIAGIWSGMVSGVSNMVGSVVAWFTGLPGQIGTALAGAATWLLDVGKHVVNGLVKGLTDWVSKLAASFLAPVTNIVDGVTSFLGIKSPSRLMMSEGAAVADDVVGAVPTWSAPDVGEGYLARRKRLSAGSTVYGGLRTNSVEEAADHVAVKMKDGASMREQLEEVDFRLRQAMQLRAA